MKLMVILAVVACANAAKLDRTYLPPSHAQSSGGSSFLQAPLQRSQQHNFGARAPSNGFKALERLETLDETPSFAANNFGSSNGYSQNAQAYNAQYNSGNEFEARPERAQAAIERNAAILRQDFQNDGETYSYAYETENGINAEEHGVATNGVEAQGGYSYTGDDGQVYSVRYTADQNGFVPQGDHLPTPPPIPAEIQAALEQNARDEANGIFDDGSYQEGKYSSGDNGHYTSNIQTGSNNGHYNNGNGYYNNENEHYNNGNIQNGNGNVNHGNENVHQGNGHVETIQDDEDTIVTNNALFRSQPARNEFGVKSQNYRAQNAENFQTQATAKAYLPPVASQKAPERAFARQQSFNPRTGYQY